MEERINRLPQTAEISAALQAGREAVASLTPKSKRRRPAGGLGYGAAESSLAPLVDFRSHIAPRIDTRPPAGLAEIISEWGVAVVGNSCC